MQDEVITDKDRERAKQCLECPICRRAREKQRGLAFWFVKKSNRVFALLVKPMRRCTTERPMNRYRAPATQTLVNKSI